MVRQCGWCGNDISTLKSNAVYCNATCRSQAHRALPCFYCGMFASEKEHLVPLSVKKFNNNDTVPTCYECNRLAGVVVFDTPSEKRKYIKIKLMKKYKKVIDMPDWTDEEIEELGPSLKNHVLATVELKTLIIRRLSWEIK